MNINLTEDLRWRLYSVALLLVFIAFCLLKWTLTPTFIDIYYHLSVMLGFNEAGGFVSRSFWEYAPVGRVHLYPPLLHFFMLIFYKLGFSALFIGRFFEFVTFPLLLFAIWRFVAALFNERLAFFALLITSSIYSFYLSAVNFIPASIAVIFGLLVFYFIEKEKNISAIIFLALAFYTHPAMPWFFIGCLVIYGLLAKEKLKPIMQVVIFSIILAIPILVYEYTFRDFVSFKLVQEKFLMELNLWIFIAAIPGALIVTRNKKRYFIFFSLFFIGMLMLFSNYRYRYLCGHGMLGLIFLSALTLDAGYEKLTQYFSHIAKVRLYSRLLLLIIFLFFFLVSPAVQYQEGKFMFAPINATYINFIPNYEGEPRGNEVSIYFSKYWKEIVKLVNENSIKGDIIYCDLSYVAGLISVLSGRATSTAMLAEVAPLKVFDPIAVSKLIIWIKNPEGIFDKSLSTAVSKYKLEKAAETDIAYIYKNPRPLGKKRINNAIIPNWIAYSLLIISMGLVAWDNKIRKLS